MAEVGVEQQFDLAVAGGEDLGVQALEQFDVAVFLVEHEVRLVELHPLGAELGELAEHLRVDGGDVVDQAAVELEFLGLRVAGEFEESVRADEHRLGDDAQRFRFVELVERFGAGQVDLRGAFDLRDDVVVVGGEPFLHRQGGHIAFVALIAAADGEQRVFRLLEAQTLVACGDGTQQDRGVEHLVVVAEIVARDEVDAGSLLQLPMLGAQLLGGGAHIVERVRALPVSFDDFLELAIAADTRES